MTGSLTGKVAVVTGGAQGLGRAISERLANEGAVVVIADVNEQGVKTAAAAIAEASGARVVGVKTDVTSEADVAKLFDGAPSASSATSTSSSPTPRSSSRRRSPKPTPRNGGR